MDVGLHLPQTGHGRDGQSGADGIIAAANGAVAAGFRCFSVNDNLLFPSASARPPQPWLDGPTLLSMILALQPQASLHALLLPMHRGTPFTARLVLTLHALSQGRMTVSLAPGSSPRAAALCGLPERTDWQRFEAATNELRQLLAGGAGQSPSEVVHASQSALTVEAPLLVATELAYESPAIWHASWGSSAGLRRIARAADGWLASAYTCTAGTFRTRRRYLGIELEKLSRSPDEVGTGLATMFTCVVENDAAARRILQEVLCPLLGATAEELQPHFLVGSSEMCVNRLGEFASAGLNVAFLWPIGDYVEQVHRLAQDVLPQLASDVEMVTE